MRITSRRGVRTRSPGGPGPRGPDAQLQPGRQGAWVRPSAWPLPGPGSL